MAHPYQRHNAMDAGHTRARTIYKDGGGSVPTPKPDPRYEIADSYLPKGVFPEPQRSQTLSGWRQQMHDIRARKRDQGE